MMASSARPAQPKAILRGHKAQVHAAVFYRHNARLLTGDAEGFIVAWDLTIMRPRAVWQAHANAILGISSWGDDRIITHGRDNRLVVWKLRAEDEASMSTALPLDPSPASRPLPWMQHMLPVNTMNFCSFASCAIAGKEGQHSSGMLVAVPNTLASEAIDIFHLPSQDRLHTVKLGEKNGMVMALSLFEKHQRLTLVAAYENGLAAVAQLGMRGWETKYQATPHSQPILSVAVSPSMDFFLSSSADAVIAKHPLPGILDPIIPGKSAGEPQDSPVSGSLGAGTNEMVASGTSALSTALATQAGTREISKDGMVTEPLKVINTKHAGQQSLRVRSDGRVFATAGWDSKVRVYSSKTMKEVAVLKWHQVGCYAIAFAEVDSPNASEPGGTRRDTAAETQSESDRSGSTETQPITGLVVVPRLVDMTLKDKRISQAKTTHWLAAGSKDGKVSLWDVF